MKNKAISLAFVYLLYAIAFVGGYFSSIWISSIYYQLAFMDIVATLIIWVFSIVLKNTSLYDPYWSLTPWALATYLLFVSKVSNVFTFILYIMFSIWSWRLTINWMITFDDLSWEDWRYKSYRARYNRFIYEFINLFGFMMMPTILVYAGLIPLLLVIVNGANAFSLFGSALVLLGTLLEFFADHDMHTFLKETKERKVCDKGLWKYTRHPNYLGENFIWIGLYVALVVSLPQYWFHFVGALLILLLFEFISIPLMEKRQIERRHDYLEYIKTTPRMVPFTKLKK